jgi:Na+/proline symporter
VSGALVLVLLIIVAFAIFSLFFVGAARTALWGSPDDAPDDDVPGPPRRPWWGNPLIWIGVSAVFILLGIFVAPHFFPAVIFFIPLVWIGKPRAKGDEHRG